MKVLASAITLCILTAGAAHAGVKLGAGVEEHGGAVPIAQKGKGGSGSQQQSGSKSGQPGNKPGGNPSTSGAVKGVGVEV